MKYILLFLTTISLLLIKSSFAQYCSNDSRYTENQYFDSTEITISVNIQYGTALDYLGNPYNLRMDLYYPNLVIDTSTKRPFILLFHGGGFSSGDKSSGDIKDLCAHLALRGFVCASVNYRIGYDFSEYGQYKARYRAIQDGNAALRYIVNNANTIRVDTNWLFVGGQSAGSLLALGMVYADQSELDSISLLYNSTAVSTELGNLYNSGNSLTNTYSIKGIFNNWGGITATEIDGDEMIPTIAFHGELDTTVLIDDDNNFLNYTLSGSRSLHNKLIANNICSELTVDTLGEHGIFRNTSSKFRAQRASCFFKSIFCNYCSNFYSTDSIPSNCSKPLSIDGNNYEQTIDVYPNPFENKINVIGLEGIMDISIYNDFGQLIYKQETNNNSIQFELSPGIYYLKIKEVNSNINFNKKLIKY